MYQAAIPFPLEAGKVEMNLRLERSVPSGLGERLLIQTDRPPRISEIRHRVGQARHDRRPRRTLRRGISRLFEESDRTNAVARLPEPVGASEDAPAQVLDVAGRRQTDCKLGQLGNRSGRASTEHALRRPLDNRGDVAVRFGRREREVSGLFLGVGYELGEAGMNRAPLRPGVARAQTAERRRGWVKRRRA